MAGRPSRAVVVHPQFTEPESALRTAGHAVERFLLTAEKFARWVHNAGNHADDPSDPNGYQSHRPGVVWVTFDKRTGTSGNATRTIYVGVEVGSASSTSPSGVARSAWAA